MGRENSDEGVAATRDFADIAAVADKAKTADDAADKGDSKCGQDFKSGAVDEHGFFQWLMMEMDGGANR